MKDASMSLGIYFEIKDAELYGGEGTTGYAATIVEISIEGLQNADFEKYADSQLDTLNLRDTQNTSRHTSGHLTRCWKSGKPKASRKCVAGKTASRYSGGGLMKSGIQTRWKSRTGYTRSEQ